MPVAGSERASFSRPCLQTCAGGADSGARPGPPLVVRAYPLHEAFSRITYQHDLGAWGRPRGDQGKGWAGLEVLASRSHAPPRLG